MDKIFVFEISESQGCFHISSLEECIKTNLMQAERFFRGKMIDGEIHDYRPIFVGTENQVQTFAKSYREYITKINPKHERFGTLEGMAREIETEAKRKAAPNN